MCDCVCVLQKLLDDPLYTGLRQLRVKGAEYQQFLDEFMQAVVNQYVIQSLFVTSSRVLLSICSIVASVLNSGLNSLFVFGQTVCPD